MIDIGSIGSGNGKEELSLPLHGAAWLAARGMVAFFVEECGMPVDTRTEPQQETPLHIACLSSREEADVLAVMRYQVEKGADVTLKTAGRKTAAELALERGKQQCHEFLTVEAKKPAASAAAAARLAEQTRAAELAAQALM